VISGTKTLRWAAGRVRVVVGCLPIVLGVLSAVVAPAAGTSGALVGAHHRVGGRTLSAWQAVWLQWRSALSDHTAAPSDSCITSGQHGPVWFLSSDDSSQLSVTIHCSVASGRYLLLAAPGIDCSTAERAPFHATTDVGLLRCARNLWRSAPPRYSFTLDGMALSPSVVASRVFEIRMPATDNYLQAPGHTHTRAAVYGVVTMLRPLNPGSHTLVKLVHYPGEPTFRTTYQLNVG
jgi:hypothetical protein